MKTTLDLDDELLRLAKKRAAAAGLTLRAYVEDALRSQLLPRPQQRRHFRLELPIVEGRAPPAVNIADRDALYDLMERG
jgi:hypothetical protein